MEQDAESFQMPTLQASAHFYFFKITLIHSIMTIFVTFLSYIMPKCLIQHMHIFLNLNYPSKQETVQYITLTCTEYTSLTHSVQYIQYNASI